MSIIVGLMFATLCVTIVAFLYAPAMMARTNGQTARPHGPSASAWCGRRASR